MIRIKDVRDRRIFGAFFGVALFAAALLVLPSAAVSSDNFPKSLTAVSPSPGASVHQVMVGIGQAIEQKTPVQNWIVQPLGGPKTWLPMMKNEQIQFANHNAADLLDAYKGGLRAYGDMEAQSFLRTVGAGHSYMFMFWTTPDTGIKKISDLKGKRVYVTMKGNPMFTNMAETQLNSAGLSLDDINNMGFSSISEITDALIEGRVAAILFPVVPSFVLRINEAKGETIFVSLTEEQSEYVAEHLPGYTVENIEANDPRFRNKSPVENAICYQNAMFTHKNTDPDLVYEITKAIYDHNDIYRDSHPAAQYWSLEHSPVSLTIPHHPGSIRYFKEKGLWTSEAEAYQKKILEYHKN